MQTERIKCANCGENVVVRPAASEVVLTVHFDPADCRAALEELGLVLRPKADSAVRGEIHDLRSWRL